MLTFLEPVGLPPARGYSHAVMTAGRVVHVAGQTAVDEMGRTVGVGDFALQADRALANLELALNAAGARLSSVAALTIYCSASVDRSELPRLSLALRKRFNEGPAPAATLLFVSALLQPEWLVEVQAVAELP